MDDHFTLGINTNMEILDININPSLGNINSSSHGSDHEFLPLSRNNFSEHRYQRHDHSLPFIPLADGTNDNPNFDFNSDHQAGSFYDPITHLPTTTNDMAKRIAGDESLGNSNRLNFSSGVTRENKANRNNYGCGGKRRKKNNNAAVEKPREVVHVRARRGEATDSHSLAERMRREKINGKLRCLQELVPGCYKDNILEYLQTMGMSVMLDVTINYIQSLQNQIEFLSMKLSAASMFYDFNSLEMDAWDTTMKGANGRYEAQVMDKMGGEGYGDLLQFQ